MVNITYTHNAIVHTGNMKTSFHTTAIAKIINELKGARESAYLRQVKQY